MTREQVTRKRDKLAAGSFSQQGSFAAPSCSAPSVTPRVFEMRPRRGPSALVLTWLSGRKNPPVSLRPDQIPQFVRRWKTTAISNGVWSHQRAESIPVAPGPRGVQRTGAGRDRRSRLQRQFADGFIAEAVEASGLCSVNPIRNVCAAETVYQKATLMRCGRSGSQTTIVFSGDRGWSRERSQQITRRMSI